jgi:type II secretory pathway component PulM
MTITPRDRRFLAWGGVSVILSAVIYFWPSGDSAPAAAPSQGSVESAEKRLARVRDIAATVPQKEAALKAVQADLAKREAGVIQAPTAAQAKAQLLQILERLCAAENPPVHIVSDQLGGAVNALGSDYGMVDVAVELQCSIEQLVNLLADIAARPELLSTNDIRVTSPSNPKDKIMGVHLLVSAVVPRKLVPEKKGAGGI